MQTGISETIGKVNQKTIQSYYSIVKNKVMKIRLERGLNEQTFESDRVYIEHEEVQYTISINKFCGILLNKVNYSDEGNDTIIIQPSVSNEITIK